MAHSIQVVEEKSEIINDNDLLLFLRILLEVLHENRDTYSSLEFLSGIWSQCCEIHAPGTIDLQLNTITGDKFAKEKFLEILLATEKRVLAFGKVIPASLINQRWRIKGVTYSDYNVDRLTNLVGKLRALID